MNAYRVARLATIAALVAVVTAGPVWAQGPSPGDPCPALHEIAQDDAGQTMWCNPTMTGDYSLVWQYGGPA